MKERYRKWGRVTRFERETLIAIDESGEAVEDGDSFTVRPLGDDITLPAAEDVAGFAREVSSLVPAGIRVERMIVSAGTAEHEFGSEKWRETTARIHIALVNPKRRLRATLDLGGESLADLPLDDVRIVAGALARVEPRGRPPRRLVVAPHVVASLLPALFHVEGVTLIQCGGNLDGKGMKIEEQVLTLETFPNWFRPSYRVRPIRMPFHLCAVATASAIDPVYPRAVAIVRILDRRHFDVLCDDGSRAFETPIAIDRIRAVGAPAAWYPYAAGAFGSEILL